MILDSYLGVSLVESDDETFRGLPVYYVIDGMQRYRFTGKDAYAKAQEKMSDRINWKNYN